MITTTVLYLQEVHPITTMRNSGKVGAVREGFQEEVTLGWVSEDEEAAREECGECSRQRAGGMQ